MEIWTLVEVSSLNQRQQTRQVKAPLTSDYSVAFPSLQRRMFGDRAPEHFSHLLAKPPPQAFYA